MKDFAANDFATIAAGLKKLKAEEVSAENEEYCTECENGGWVQVYSPHPPDFGVCQKCFNPQGHPPP